MPAMQMVVNISPLHIKDSSLINSVSAALETSGLSPELLTLEFTDTVIKFRGGHRHTIEKLSRLGIKIAVENFGSGIASLESLKHLPLEYLKIHPRFITDLMDNPGTANLIGPMVNLAKALGCTVIAKGVAFEQQAQLLVGIGCSLGQGGYLGKTLSGSQLAAQLQATVYKGGAESVLFGEQVVSELS